MELSQLKQSGSFWSKFVQVGGLEKDDPTVAPQTGGFWRQGKTILQNIETRRTVERKMKRPPDPLVNATETPETTGAWSKANRNEEDLFDVDIDAFDLGEPQGVDPATFEAYQQSQMRSHATLINRAKVAVPRLVPANVTSETLLEPEEAPDTTAARRRHNNTAAEGDALMPAPRDYNTVLTFIEGTLVGLAGDADDPSSGIDSDLEENCAGLYRGRQIPTMKGVAHSAGKSLDEKQYIAYEIICCTFLLRLVHEGGTAGSDLGNYLNATLCCTETDKRDTLVERLKARGAQDQLLMLLTGPAGCGKSTSVELAQQYCHKFCMAVAIAFDDITFYFTSTTGSSAALFGGMTIHSAAHLNKRVITDAYKKDWENVRILIIDEISFFTVTEMKKLDNKLKRLTGRYDVPYGGISIVFSGDFHQLRPVARPTEILYSCSPGAMAWQNTINCAIFLENSHRFRDDPEYGEIMGRMRMGKDTSEDREKINSRLIGHQNDVDVQLPTNPDACYACPTNKERNAITAGVFRNHILETHPAIESDDMPPEHTLMIEASMRRKRKRVSQALHDSIVTALGDDDVRATEFNYRGAKIDPLLRLFPGSPHMCITNDDLDKGRGNGTLCRCVGVKLKKRAKREWKNWEGRKVWTVSADDVKWVKFEHWPNPPRGAARIFKLKPQTFTSTVHFPLSPDCDGLKLRLGNVKITQIPVNSNIATTGHKLQGMSKDDLIVNSWNYSFPNWVYVVLSRVRTLSGLYLCKPLDLDRPFKVPDDLIQFEQRMKRLESYFLDRR